MWFSSDALAPILALSLSCYGISFLLQKRFRAATSVLDETALLGLARKEGKKLAGTVVICGGSIAGLLSARVCSDHFESVIIIEPEGWVATDEGLEDRHRHDPSSHRRSRVPQYTAVHAYQVYLLMALRKLFVNFDTEAKRAGGRIAPATYKLHLSGGLIPAPVHQYPKDKFPTNLYQTRPGYETTLRRLVKETCPNVRYMSGSVTGLIREDTGRNVVTSVQFRSNQGEESTLSAALVIDCTGPALGGLRWLQDLSSDNSGHDQKIVSFLKSLKTTYDHKMAYTTCEIDVPQHLLEPLQALGFSEDFQEAGCPYATFPDPSLDKRHFVVLRQENNILHIVCGGWDVHERVASIDDIKNFVSGMILRYPIPEWVPKMLNLFEEEQVPVTFTHNRCAPSVYVQYHRAENLLPSNFIAIGDSVLQVNPVRGQGCTKACVEAVTLNALLSRYVHPKRTAHSILPDDFSCVFFDLQAKRTGMLWDIYKTEDYAWNSTTPEKGDSLTKGAWKRMYGTRLNKLLLQDRDAAAVWWKVFNWLTPVTDLFSPTILMKLAWMQLRELTGNGRRGGNRI